MNFLVNINEFIICHLLFQFTLATFVHRNQSFSSEIVSNTETRRLQFEGMIENMHVAAVPQKRRKKNSTSKRLTRAQAIAKAVHNIEVEMDMYHRWWMGPVQLNTFIEAAWGASHRFSENVVFSTLLELYAYPTNANTSSMSPNISQRLSLFLASARSVYAGDIVIAVPAPVPPHIQHLLQRHSVVVYEVPRDLCSQGEGEGEGAGKLLASVRCGSADERVPYTVFKFFFYERWAALYNKTSSILITDVVDSYFQADPFPAQTDSSRSVTPLEWKRESPLLLFAHFHPNNILRRLPSLAAVFAECYGHEALSRHGHRTAVSASAFYGTRDGALVWSHAMTVELQEAPGRFADAACSGVEIVHAIANWLAVAPKARAVLATAQVAQGEGVVNPIAGLTGRGPETTTPQSSTGPVVGPVVGVGVGGSLRQFWRVVRGDGWVRNWDGEVAPVVQYSEAALAELLSSSIDAAAGAKQSANPIRDWLSQTQP